MGMRTRMRMVEVMMLKMMSVIDKRRNKVNISKMFVLGGCAPSTNNAKMTEPKTKQRARQGDAKKEKKGGERSSQELGIVSGENTEI